MNNLVTVKDGVPTTNSLIIAELFNRKHSDVLKSLDMVAERETSLSDCVSSYIDASGKSNRMYLLNEWQSYIVMPFIGGIKSIDGQIKLVYEFKALREKYNKILEAALKERNAVLDLAEKLITYRESKLKKADEDEIRIIRESSLHADFLGNRLGYRQFCKGISNPKRIRNEGLPDIN